MHQIFKTCYQSWMPHWKYLSRTYSSIKTKTFTHPTKALCFSQPQTTILFSASIQFKYPTEIESARVYPFVSGLSYLALSLQVNAHCHKYKIFLFCILMPFYHVNKHFCIHSCETKHLNYSPYIDYHSSCFKSH